VFVTGHSMAQRIETANQRTGLSFIATKQQLLPAGGAASLLVGDGVAVFGGAASPVRAVTGLGMHAPVTAEVLATAVAFFTERHVEPVIELCPLAHPSLVERLRAHRFAALRFRHCYVRATPLPGLAHAQSPPPGLEIRPATAPERALWARTIDAGFTGQLPEEIALDALDTSWVVAHKPDTICFLALLGGIPVGGGALSLIDDMGLLYSTCVLGAARRLGIQQALLAARIDYAAGHGCRRVSVQAEPGTASARNIERAGFSLAYTKTITGPLPRPGHTTGDPA
jgi:GNAT superfamily N-acetyltransferase